MENNFILFADCGAPSLYNKLSRKIKVKRGPMGSTMKDRKKDDFTYVRTKEYREYRDSYIAYMLENKGMIDVYSNLDVINNPKLTKMNQLILEREGLNPIPVWHLGSDVSYLDELVANYEYIAIGGLVPNPTTVLIPILDRIWKDHLTDKDGFPKVKVHGFACTSLPLILRYPWFSVDSATCRKLSMYGSIVMPEFNSERLVTMQVSSRDIKLKDRMSNGNIHALIRAAKKYNMTQECLTDSIVLRGVWNYIVFLEKINTLIPNWPWRHSHDTKTNVTTRESKDGAEEYLTFLMAGVLSRKEEEIFWLKMKEYDYKGKGRLQSFFYKQAMEQAIDLKTGR